ncbi:MAG: hypothetical protein KGR46_10580 [Verrucomicrobia bacterium]|nr:hypothetical protein [Verrucomicrobiota bacterium]
MLRIDWNPPPAALRRWAVAVLAGTAIAGAILHFLLNHTTAATVLWSFGALAFATGITGTRAARPFYMAWMGLAWLISQTLGTAALAIVFFFVATPIALATRLLGRDRLLLRRPAADSLWGKSPPVRTDRFDRPF